MAADHTSLRARPGIGRVRQALSGGGILPTALACLALAALAAVLARCAFYGSHSPDESYYLAVPYRVYLGDALLIDEWQGSQFSAFLLYLPLTLFIRFTGSTDGILLFFRILFVICQTLVSFFVFIKVKRFGILTGLCSAGLFLLYVPEFMEALDYYTMSMMAVELIVVILFFSDRITAAKGVAVGILAACAVVSLPMLAVVYFVYAAAVPIAGIRSRKTKHPARGILSLRFFCSVTAGILLIFILFLFFLAARAPLNAYLKNIGNLFSGYDYVLSSANRERRNTFNYFAVVKNLFRLQPVGFLLSLLITVGLVIDRRRLAHRTFWCALLSVFYVYYAVSMLCGIPGRLEQSLLCPYILYMFTIHCYILTEKRNRKLLFVLCGGGAYILCLGAASAVFQYVGVLGCVIGNTAFAPVIKDLHRELRCATADFGDGDKRRFERRIPAILTAACVVCAVGIALGCGGSLVVSDRVDSGLRWDGEPIRETVENGPMKGIIVSQREKAVYDRVSADIGLIHELAPGGLYIEGRLPVGYLMYDARVCACSAWYVDNPELTGRYYEADPNRIPQAVYLPTEDIYADEELFRFLIQMFIRDYGKTHPLFADYERIKGEAGYILLAPDARE